MQDNWPVAVPANFMVLGAPVQYRSPVSPHPCGVECLAIFASANCIDIAVPTRMLQHPACFWVINLIEIVSGHSLFFPRIPL